MNEHDAAFDYRNGTLDGDEKARFESHLETCARCQAELADYDRLREVAKAATKDDVPSTRLTGTLRAQLLREASTARKPKPRSRLRVAGYAAAAGLLVVVGAIALSQRGERVSKTPERSESDASERSESDALERARQLAHAGRCQEATDAYAAIERRAPARLDAHDRAAYDPCNRIIGGSGPAQR